MCVLQKNVPKVAVTSCCHPEVWPPRMLSVTKETDFSLSSLELPLPYSLAA